MIEAKLEDGRRIFVPMSQVRTITEDSDKKLTLVHQRHDGELVWRKITFFQILGTGKKVS